MTNEEEKQYLVDQLKQQYEEVFVRSGVNLAEKVEKVDEQVKQWQVLWNHLGWIFLNWIRQKNGMYKQVLNQQKLFQRAQEAFRNAEGPMVGKASVELKEIWDESSALLRNVLIEEADRMAKQEAMDTDDGDTLQSILPKLMKAIQGPKDKIATTMELHNFNFPSASAEGKQESMQILLEHKKKIETVMEGIENMKNLLGDMDFENANIEQEFRNLKKNMKKVPTELRFTMEYNMLQSLRTTVEMLDSMILTSHGDQWVLLRPTEDARIENTVQRIIAATDCQVHQAVEFVQSWTVEQTKLSDTEKEGVQDRVEKFKQDNNHNRSEIVDDKGNKEIVVRVWADEEMCGLDQIPEMILRVLFKNKVKDSLVAAYKKQDLRPYSMQMNMVQVKMQKEMWKDMTGWLRNIGIDNDDMETTLRRQAEKWKGRMIRERPIKQTAKQDRSTPVSKPAPRYEMEQEEEQGKQVYGEITEITANMLVNKNAQNPEGIEKHYNTHRITVSKGGEKWVKEEEEAELRGEKTVEIKLMTAAENWEQDEVGLMAALSRSLEQDFGNLYEETIGEMILKPVRMGAETRDVTISMDAQKYSMLGQKVKMDVDKLIFQENLVIKVNENVIRFQVKWDVDRPDYAQLSTVVCLVRSEEPARQERRGLWDRIQDKADLERREFMNQAGIRNHEDITVAEDTKEALREALEALLLKRVYKDEDKTVDLEQWQEVIEKRYQEFEVKIRKVEGDNTGLRREVLLPQWNSVFGELTHRHNAWLPGYLARRFAINKVRLTDRLVFERPRANNEDLLSLHTESMRLIRGENFPSIIALNHRKDRAGMKPEKILRALNDWASKENDVHSEVFWAMITKEVTRETLGGQLLNNNSSSMGGAASLLYNPRYSEITEKLVSEAKNRGGFVIETSRFAEGDKGPAQKGGGRGGQKGTKGRTILYLELRRGKAEQNAEKEERETKTREKQKMEEDRLEKEQRVRNLDQALKTKDPRGELDDTQDVRKDVDGAQIKNIEVIGDKEDDDTKGYAMFETEQASELEDKSQLILENEMMAAVGKTAAVWVGPTDEKAMAGTRQKGCKLPPPFHDAHQVNSQIMRDLEEQMMKTRNEGTLELGSVFIIRTKTVDGIEITYEEWSRSQLKMPYVYVFIHCAKHSLSAVVQDVAEAKYNYDVKALIQGLQKAGDMIGEFMKVAGMTNADAYIFSHVVQSGLDVYTAQLHARIATAEWPANVTATMFTSAASMTSTQVQRVIGQQRISEMKIVKNRREDKMDETSEYTTASQYGEAKKITIRKKSGSNHTKAAKDGTDGGVTGGAPTQASINEKIYSKQKVHKEQKISVTMAMCDREEDGDRRQEEDGERRQERRTPCAASGDQKKRAHYKVSRSSAAKALQTVGRQFEYKMRTTAAEKRRKGKKQKKATCALLLKKLVKVTEFLAVIHTPNVEFEDQIPANFKYSKKPEMSASIARSSGRVGFDALGYNSGSQCGHPKRKQQRGNEPPSHNNAKKEKAGERRRGKGKAHGSHPKSGQYRGMPPSHKNIQKGKAGERKKGEAEVLTREGRCTGKVQKRRKVGLPGKGNARSKKKEKEKKQQAEFSCGYNREGECPSPHPARGEETKKRKLENTKEEKKERKRASNFSFFPRPGGNGKSVKKTKKCFLPRHAPQGRKKIKEVGKKGNKKIGQRKKYQKQEGKTRKQTRKNASKKREKK